MNQTQNNKSLFPINALINKTLLPFLLILFMTFLVTGCGKKKPTSPTKGILEVGEVRGRVSFYGWEYKEGEPPDKFLKRAFLSTIQFVTIPHILIYLDGYIIDLAGIRPDGTYIFENVPLGSYYLNIGCVEQGNGNPYSIANFPFMSFHSITPFVQVTKGEIFIVPDIELLPGGGAVLKRWIGESDSTKQGFNFSLARNVSTLDSADIWYDVLNDRITNSGDNIAEVPSEPEGLCYILVAPDSGYKSELISSSHFVVRTKDGTYAKCRITAGGSSSTGYRRIDIQWMLQPDGSKRFSY